jgi:hypothetical protein
MGGGLMGEHAAWTKWMNMDYGLVETYASRYTNMGIPFPNMTSSGFPSLSIRNQPDPDMNLILEMGMMEQWPRDLSQGLEARTSSRRLALQQLFDWADHSGWRTGPEPPYNELAPKVVRSDNLTIVRHRRVGSWVGRLLAEEKRFVWGQNDSFPVNRSWPLDTPGTMRMATGVWAGRTLFFGEFYDMYFCQFVQAFDEEPLNSFTNLPITFGGRKAPHLFAGYVLRNDDDDSKEVHILSFRLDPITSQITTPTYSTMIHKGIHLVPQRFWADLIGGHIRPDMANRIIQNAEVYRLYVEHYGEERYIKDAGLEPIDESEFGVLYGAGQTVVQGQRALGTYEIDMLDTWFNIVKVEDGTTPGRFYYLQVPGSCKTARAAVAWTFQMEEHEYAPEMLT